jgi:hypothetical protein
MSLKLDPAKQNTPGCCPESTDIYAEYSTNSWALYYDDWSRYIRYCPDCGTKLPAFTCLPRKPEKRKPKKRRKLTPMEKDLKEMHDTFRRRHAEIVGSRSGLYREGGGFPDLWSKANYGGKKRGKR